MSIRRVLRRGQRQVPAEKAHVKMRRCVVMLMGMVGMVCVGMAVVLMKTMSVYMNCVIMRRVAIGMRVRHNGLDKTDDQKRRKEHDAYVGVVGEAWHEGDGVVWLEVPR